MSDAAVTDRHTNTVGLWRRRTLSAQRRRTWTGPRCALWWTWWLLHLRAALRLWGV